MDLTIRQIRDEIAGAQNAGKLDPPADSELLASDAEDMDVDAEASTLSFVVEIGIAKHEPLLEFNRP